MSKQRQYADWAMAFTTGRDEVDALAGVERNHIFGDHGSDAEAVMLRQVTLYQSTMAGITPRAPQRLLSARHKTPPQTHASSRRKRPRTARMPLAAPMRVQVAIL